MKIGEVSSREVYRVRPDEPLANAVREMRNRHVGVIVVAEETDGRLQLVGVVTDRDILNGQLERGADLFCLNVSDVMTPDPLAIADTSDVATAIERMSASGVRRAPVVNGSGDLVGIVSIDDLLPAVAEQLAALAKLIGTQARKGRSGA